MFIYDNLRTPLMQYVLKIISLTLHTAKTIFNNFNVHHPIVHDVYM
jgi:hypothetical protein